MPILSEHQVRFISLGSATVLLNIANADAAENYWTGVASNDWNTPDNWNLGRVPIDADNVHIDISGAATSPFRARISADILQVTDLLISRGGLDPNSPGILDHIAVNAAKGISNWLDAGTNGTVCRLTLSKQRDSMAVPLPNQRLSLHP